MQFIVELCSVPIEVHHHYPQIRNLCTDYLAVPDTLPAFSVSVTDTELEAEMAITEGCFSRGACESTCLHRAIVQRMVSYGVILIHAAVVAVDGVAYAFLAKSGVGKSTHIQLWQKAFGERAVIINGDKPFFSFEGDRLMVHGSPWRGKEGLGANLSAPIGGICFLERGTANVITSATPAEVVGRLFHQVLIPHDREEQTAFMATLDRILREIPLYRLACNMDLEAARVAYAGMKLPTC